jgi:malonate transporter
MSILVGVVAPIFGVIALGFVGVKVKVLDEGAVRGLVLYVFNFAIPILLFRSLALTELPANIEWSFLVSYYGGALVVFFLGMAAGRGLFHRPLEDQAIFGMGAGFSNTVLMGLPILLTAFGPEANLPVFLLIAFHGPILMTLVSGLIEVGRGEASLGNQVRTVGLELVRNPIIVGLAVGLAANLGGFVLPGPLDRMAEMMGATAVPCALFALGSALAAYPLTGDVAPAMILTSLKLLVHPALVWVLAVPVMGLEGIWVPVAVTMAAMPSGINVYLFGARYDAAKGVAARTVFLSTIFSVGTISVLLYLFQGGY